MPPSIRRVLPGLFKEAAREPSVPMYSQGGGFTIVPRLDMPSSKQPGSPDPLNRGSAHSASGEAAMNSNPVLFGPIWRIAFRMGALPLKFYEFVDAEDDDKTDGEPAGKQRQEASDHPAYKLMRSPNPDMTRNLLISGTVVNMMVNSVAAWWKERKIPYAPATPDNPVVALWPIPNQNLYIVKTPNRVIGGVEIRVQGAEPIRLNRRDVCLFRLMPKPGDWTAYTSPVATLGDTLHFAEQAITAMTDMFETAFLQRLWVDLHGADLEDPAFARLQAQMEQARRNRWGVPVMESGATIESMGTYGSTVEDKILSNAISLAEDTTKWTFGFPEKADDLQMFYGEVIQPVADAIEQELERSLMDEWPDQPAFPEFQFREILAGSPLQRADLWQKKILSAQATPNEARKSENLPPKEGGDELFIPLNVGTVEEAIKPDYDQFLGQVGGLSKLGVNPNLVDPTTGKLMPTGKVSTTKKLNTKGGIGGSEGKGTLVKTPMPKSKAAAEDEDDQAARGFARNWSTFRTRSLTRQSQAVERRLRGVMKDEKAALDNGVEEPADIIAYSNLRVAELLGQFGTQVGQLAASEAAKFAGNEDEVVLPDSTRTAISQRATGLADNFGMRRLESFRSDGTDGWDTFANHLSGPLALNEAAWAFDRAAAATWASELEVVRGGGECRTGVCDREAAPGKRVQPDEVPTPLHPGCTCFILPVRFT